MKYFSDKTQKVYDDVAALEAAEKEYDDAHAAELAKKEARAAAAKEVEDAYKAANDALKAANAKMNDFIKEYGAYHKTFSTALPTTKSLVDLMFDSFWL